MEAAWYRHSILLFRGLDMNVDDHIAFTRRFGPLHLMPGPEHNLDGNPEIFVVSNALKQDGTPLGLRGAGMGFHSDGEDKPVPNAVEGLPAEEGRELATYLQEFAHQPRFVYRHQWRKGDAVLWDNRCVQHSATPFDETRYVRLMHRTTLEGETPLMA